VTVAQMGRSGTGEKNGSIIRLIKMSLLLNIQ